MVYLRMKCMFIVLMMWHLRLLMWNDLYQQWVGILERVVDIICVRIDLRHVGKMSLTFVIQGHVRNLCSVWLLLPTSSLLKMQSKGRSRVEEAEMKVRLLQFDLQDIADFCCTYGWSVSPTQKWWRYGENVRQNLCYLCVLLGFLPRVC